MSRRLAALAGLLALVVGVPLMLLETSGAPGLDGLPDLEGLRRAVDLRWIPVEWAIRVLALAAWALWAYLLLAVLLRIAGAIEARFPARGRLWEASEAFTWAPVKLLVDLSLGAILLSGTVGHDPARAAARPSGWSATAAPQVAAIRNEAAPGVHTGRVQLIKKGVPRGEQHQVRAATNGDYVVRPGDSLWTIAERELKDPYRWKEIWRLNEGRAMPDGERLSRPGFVRPGWSLRLPTAPDSDRGRDECENGGQATRESPSATNRDRPHRRHAEHAPKVDRQSQANQPSPEPSSDEHRHPSQHDRVELPSGTAVAISFAAGFISAIGMRELAARRRRAPRSLSPGWPRASSGRNLKSRLLRRIGWNGEGAVAKEDIDAILRDWEPDSNAILLGHRDGSPVLASSRSRVYRFTGDSMDVHSYFRDLLLNTLVSNPESIEIWTTRDLGYEDIKRLRIFTDARSLVSELEIEVIKRHRLLDEEGMNDWNAHQDAWPDDPLPQLMTVLPGCDEGLGNRLGAVAAQGQDLGIFVVREGPGSGSVAIEGKALWPVGSDMREVLGHEPFAAITIAEADRSEVLKALAPAPDEPDEQDETEPVQIAPPDRAPADAGPPIKVRLFGPPEILGVQDDQPDGFGAKSRELLFFFLLHPQGATREQAMEALWPDTDIAKGIDKFWFQMRTVRNHLRSDDAPTAKFIDKFGDSYRPVPDLFDVDVWEFDRLIAGAEAKDNVRASLSTVGDLYRGDLLQGIYYPWVEPLQAHFRKQFIDAMVRLSQVCSAEGDDEAAVGALLKAIAVDRYAEHLYRSVMGLYARLGRRNDVERVYKELEAALAEELEAQPDPETHSLKNRLLTQGIEEGSAGLT